MADSRKINEEYARIGAELIATEESLADIKASNATIIISALKHHQGKMVDRKSLKVSVKKWLKIQMGYSSRLYHHSI